MEADLIMTGSSNSGGGTQSKAWGRAIASKLPSSATNSLTSGSGSTLAKGAALMSGFSGSGGVPQMRRVGPSSSQLYLVRTMLELMIDQSSSSPAKHSFRKDIDSTTMAAIDNFLKHSFYWPYLLNFSGWF